MWLTGADVLASRGCPTCTAPQATVAAAAAQGYAEKWCRRLFEAADVAEWVRSVSPRVLHLDRYPVNVLKFVSVDADTGIRVAYSGSARYAAVSCSPTTLTLTTTGPASTSSLTLATYPTMALLAAAVTALGSGWSGSVENEGTPSHIQPCSLGDICGTSGTLDIPGRPVEADLVDAASGVVCMTAGPATPIGGRGLPVFASYNGGYVTIPAELKEVGVELACDVLRAAKRDSMLASESLGEYSWTLRTDIEFGGLWRAYESRLQPWKRLIV